MRRLLGILAALAFALPAAAQGFEMTAPNLVAADEQFNVTFKIDGDKAPSDFEWSPGDDFKLVWGPQKGSSSSISIINGKTTRTSTTTYTYVLMPRSTGTFTLPPASATIKGKKVSSASRTIQVVGGGQQQGSQGGQARQQGTQSQDAAGELSGDDIFMRMSISKSSVVVGEGLTATLKLYTRVPVAGFEDARFPTFDGFWSQQLQAPQNIQFQRENVGGRIYDAAVLRSWNLIPQKSGEISVDPAELICLVNVRKPSTGGSIFDSFFQDDYRTIRKRVHTPAIAIRVSALPAGAPASFGGGVGQFAIKASLTRDSLKTHDAASLKLTVTGSGNTALLEAPRISFPPDFEVYDVKITDVRGGKTFEYPFIPRSHGDFVIGPVEYSYYDIAKGRYVTLQTQALPLSVERSASAQAQADRQQGTLSVEKKDVKDLGSDIRYISTRKPSFSSPGRFFLWSPLFFGLLGGLLLLAAGLYFGLRKRAELRADVARTRNRGAVKMARKRLAAAGKFLQQNLDAAFWEELHRTLLGFVSDKLGMDAAEMSRENILERLQAAGASDSVAQEFCSLLDECEYARYAPAAGQEAMSAQYEKAVSVISEIDSCMKKKASFKAGAVLLALLIFCAPALSSQAAPASAGPAGEAYLDSLWTAGVNAYTVGDYVAARDAWLAISELGLASPELYTNTGNAFFKTDDYARAVLWYERALRLDPSFADARHNLALAQGMVQDRIEQVPEFFLVSWLRSLGWKLSSDAWAVLFLVLLAGALALALLFLLGRSQSARRTGFFLGIALLLLSMASLGFSSWQRRENLKADSAIVISPVVAVKSTPGAGVGRDLFILHEGTKVRINDSVSGWVNIELSDGRQGWMREDNLEKV
ncbi:MAG: BatD family protein [Bacteroidales bacterium]|nr:BatD family protein [Bacteroidales bacterium]